MEKTCQFIKRYNEPNIPYICFSTSLFVSEIYMKYDIEKEEQINVKNEKQQKYLNTLIEVSKRLLNGYYPNNLFYRIYYDHTIKNNPFWKNFLIMAEKHPKIQLVYYKCSKFININGFHHKFFGTIVRFHAFFDKDSNTKCVVSIDSDVFYRTDFLNEINKFIDNDNYQFIVFAGIHNSPFHKPDYDYKNAKIVDYLWFPGGLTGIKIKLNIDIWDNLFNILYNDFNLRNMFNFIDFKQKAIYPNIKLESNASFEYGSDEIFFNYILKNYIKKNLYNVYWVKMNNNFMLHYSTKFADYLSYNLQSNLNVAKILIKNIIDNDNYNNSISKIKKMHDNNKLIEISRKNIEIMKKMYFSSDIFYFLLNFDDLYKNYESLKPMKNYFVLDLLKLKQVESFKKK
jgi:hypothetical protein